MPLPDFLLTANLPVSQQFTQQGISTFHQAINLVQQWPYGRNANKNNLLSLFDEKRGTCSTKHALLKQLAMEHEYNDIRLVIGLYKMNAENSPLTKIILSNNALDYIPEAHCYLVAGEERYDFTSADFLLDFVPDLLHEREVFPDQVNDFKIEYHRKYLQQWLAQHPHIAYTLDELWKIRELCIHALEHNRTE